MPLTKAVIIREARAEDFPAIYSIWEEGLAIALGTDRSMFRNTEYVQFFENLLKAQNELFKFWVATDINDEVLGWQSLLPFRNNPIIRRLMAESSTYVRRHTHVPELGKKLLEHAISHASGTPIQQIVGFVSKTNRAAIRMVKSLGFDLCGEVPATLKEPKMDSVNIYVYSLH